MSIDALSLASYFLNSFIILAVNASFAYAGLDAFFPRRRSPVLFWCYFGLKTLVWSAFEVVFLLGDPSDVVSALWVTSGVLFGVLSYIVLYYSWDTSILKIGVAATVVDLVAGFAVLIGMVVYGVVSGTGQADTYTGYLGVKTVIITVVSVVVFYLFLFVVRPLGKRLAALEVSHESVWRAIIIVVVAVLALSRISENGSYSVRMLGAAMSVVVLLVPIILWSVVWRGRREREREIMLLRRRALMGSYDDALRSQSEFIEDSRESLDHLAEEISRLQDGALREDLARNLTELRDLCDRLRFGAHSDSPVLDAVLSLYEKRFAQADAQVEYRVQPLSSGQAQAAAIAQVILEWALGACEAAGSAAASTEGERTKAQLRISKSANQLVFVADIPAGRYPRLSRSALASTMPAFRGVMREEKQDGRRRLHVMVEKAAEWK